MLLLHRFCGFALTIVLICQSGFACSIFVIDAPTGPIVGRNYDWHTGTGQLVVNKRGLHKTALVSDHPATWVSKFGSVTFNQYGREFPCGGMNEQGLVVEVLWLEGTQYPKPDERPGIPTLQWIQYQLDTAANVEELIASDNDVRIQTISATYVHFFAVDKSGARATIEFLDGKRVVHRDAKALTNSTYAASQSYLDQRQDAARYDGSSLGRFAQAAVESRTPTSKPVSKAFEILRNVAQGGFTKWSIVYDPAGSRIDFLTQSARTPRHLSFATVDFSEDSSAQILPLDQDFAGDSAQHLSPATYESNKALIKKAFAETPIFDVLAPVLLERLARYPESCRRGVALEVAK